MVEVTRSLSNLLKGFYVPVTKAEARVIDSNELISEKLVHIRNTVNTDGFSSEGFCAGLNPLNVSEVLDENNNIIGDEPVAASELQDTLEAETMKEEIINEANEQANAIIGRANEDAMSIIENAKLEAEKILLEAREAGYSEGMQKANAEAEAVKQQVINEYKEKEQSLVAEYRRKAEEMEPELVDIILKIFADITKSVAMDKRDMILTLVNNVMEGGEPSRNFVIRASVEDAIFLRENKDKIIGSSRNDIHIEVVSDPSMKRNECLIDTDTGVYDCSLDIQLENLINDIRILSASGE